VPPQKLLDAVRDGAYGRNTSLAGLKSIFKGKFDSVQATVDIIRKDVGLATGLGRELEVPMAIASRVEQDLIEAVARGFGEKDMRLAFTVQEDRAGIKVRE